MEWILPIKTISEFNKMEHHLRSWKRHKIQKNEIVLWWITERPVVNMPCTIKLTRISPRMLDDDNLRGAFKWIRDAIADKIRPGFAPGRADDTEEMKWEYSQRKGKPQAIKIEIA